MARASKLALWGAFTFLLASCGSNPVPDLESYGWCASIDFSQPQANLIIPVGTQTATGIQSADGTLSAIYTHSSIIEAAAIEAQFDIEYIGGASKTVVAEFDVFGIEQSAQTQISGSISTAIGATATVAGAGSNNASVVVVTDPDVTITIRRMRVAGAGDSPFGTSLNCDEGNATSTPQPTGTPPIFNLPSPTPSNTPTPSPTPTNTPTPTITPTLSTFGIYASEWVTFNQVLDLNPAMPGSIYYGGQTYGYVRDYGSYNHHARVVAQELIVNFAYGFSPPDGAFAWASYCYGTPMQGLCRWHHESRRFEGYSPSLAYFSQYMPSGFDYAAHAAALGYTYNSNAIAYCCLSDPQSRSIASGIQTYNAQGAWVENIFSPTVSIEIKMRFWYTSPVPATATPLATSSPTATHTITPTNTWQPNFTPSPYPTNTPWPTQTAYPTYTPFPTNTAGPLPTYTAYPTYTPLPASTNAGPQITATSAGTGTGGGSGSGGSGIGLDFGAGWGTIGNPLAIFGAVTNFFNSGWAWFQLGINLPTRFASVYNSTPAAALPGVPQCMTNPVGNNLCAIYYILESTIFAKLGVVIIPMMVVIVDLAIFMSVLKYVKAVLRWIEQVVSS